MNLSNTIFVGLGALTVCYGLLILWSAYQKPDEDPEKAWLKPEELADPRLRRFDNMRYLLRPARSTAAVSKSRGWLMLAAGVAIIVFALL